VDRQTESPRRRRAIPGSRLRIDRRGGPPPGPPMWTPGPRALRGHSTDRQASRPEGGEGEFGTNGLVSNVEAAYPAQKRVGPLSLTMGATAPLCRGPVRRLQHERRLRIRPSRMSTVTLDVTD
jgi:hypothetical protein